MKKSVTLDKFGLGDFIQSNLGFYKTVLNEGINPTDIVQELTGNEGQVRDIQENETRDLESELLKDNKSLFFPFSDIGMTDSIRCANGNSYEISEESEFCIGDNEQAGLVVNVNNDTITFESAVFSGGFYPSPPSIDICDCDVFDKPMQDYVESFVK